MPLLSVTNKMKLYCYRTSPNHLHLDRVHVTLTPADWTSFPCRQELLRKPKSLRDGCGQLAGWWYTTIICPNGYETMTFSWKVTDHQWTRTGNASSLCFVFTPRPAIYGLICWVWQSLLNFSHTVFLFLAHPWSGMLYNLDRFCQTMTFERLRVGSLYLHIWCISMLPRDTPDVQNMNFLFAHPVYLQAIRTR